ncbi:hypothetical protein BD779DRAFT_449296 [Infundibulicybe gibba]|nr:hypothetical protein BD779DRAFT_449296 [Infundibulicybe gibba]
MSTEVPLKIRMDIRDQWDSPKSSVQKSVDALAQKLGHKVTPHIEWPALWNELKDGYPEKGTFVSTVARLIVAWYERLLWRLQSEMFPDWTEKLLSVLVAAAPTRLNIESSSPPHTQPYTTWRTTTKSFYLGIPKVAPPSQAQFVTSLDKDFENLFASPDSGSAIEHEEGRADVTVEDTPPAPVANQAQPQPQPLPLPDENSAIRRLPVIDAIPQPTELFRNNAPYYLVVETGGCPIRVQSSHEPSLELLAAYINKWGRTNTRDSSKVRQFQPPVSTHLL